MRRADALDRREHVRRAAARRSRARSAVVSTMAQPPSVSMQQSRRRSGSATQRDAWWSASVMGSRMSAFGFRTAWLRMAHATSPKWSSVVPWSSMWRRAMSAISCTGAATPNGTCHWYMPSMRGAIFSHGRPPSIMPLPALERRPRFRARNASTVVAWPAVIAAAALVDDGAVRAAAVAVRREEADVRQAEHRRHVARWCSTRCRRGRARRRRGASPASSSAAAIARQATSASVMPICFANVVWPMPTMAADRRMVRRGAGSGAATGCARAARGFVLWHGRDESRNHAGAAAPPPRSASRCPTHGIGR